MNIVEAYNAIKSGERVVNVDGELLSINDSHQLCVERTGKIVPFSAWAMKDNSFWPASEKNCEICNERPPRYGDRFCSDACAKAFTLLQKQQEFIDILKALPEEERLKIAQKATATDGIFRPYIDPLLPGQEQVIGYKQDRVAVCHCGEMMNKHDQLRGCSTPKENERPGLNLSGIDKSAVLADKDDPFVKLTTAVDKALDLLTCVSSDLIDEVCHVLRVGMGLECEDCHSSLEPNGFCKVTNEDSGAHEEGS